jgi:hypothetical protein
MLTAVNTFSMTGLVAIYPNKARWINVNLVNNIVLARGTVLGELTAGNDVQTVTVGGTAPTGGTFTLTLNSQTTAPIAYNATATQVAAALAALPGVGTGNVVGSGGPLPGANVVLTFQGALGSQAVNVITGTFTGLTGGAPTWTVAHTTTGQPPGVYKAYAAGNGDGSQIPKGILEYDCATDASGNITLGGSAIGGQFGQTQKAVPMYVQGDFYTTELVGLDANALTAGLGHLLEGTVANGVVAIA